MTRALTGRLEGKVAFITGSARGLGRSHAVRFAQEGADIIGVDICADMPNLGYRPASTADLDETVALVAEHGRRMVAHVADVTDKRELRAAVDDGVAQLGHLDIVLTNAGTCAIGHFPLDAHFQAVDTTLVGVMNTVSCAYPHLPDGASIIATGSAGALVPDAVGGSAIGPGGRGYAYAKRSIAQYVRELALTLAPRMIRVNALHPASCNTEMTLNARMYELLLPGVEQPTREQVEQAFQGMHAMPIPWIEPEDVTNAALFLASDESRYVTGVQLRVDAGSVVKLVPDAL